MSINPKTGYPKYLVTQRMYRWLKEQDGWDEDEWELLKPISYKQKDEKKE